MQAMPPGARVARDALVPFAARGQLSALLLDAPSDDVVLSFASIGHDAARPPSPEFVASASGMAGPLSGRRRAVFIQDAGRSWGNDPDLPGFLAEVMERLEAQRPIRRSLAMGLSMGAFTALVAARHLPLDAVLAFGPQASVDPELVPGEMRWREWTDRLGPLTWPQAPLSAGPWTVILHGLQDDAEQAALFAPGQGVDHILFPAQGHAGLVPHLKGRGMMGGLVEAMLDGDRRRLLRLLSGAGGQRRRQA